VVARLAPSASSPRPGWYSAIAARSAAFSGAPQSPQKIASEGFSAPHRRHRPSSRAPHRRQNFLPDGVSELQLVQRMANRHAAYFACKLTGFNRES
jgi:hypothetical protein